MAADEDDKSGSGAEERRQRERRQKPPVTIDLTAEAVQAKAAAFDAKPAGDAPPRETPKTETRASAFESQNRAGAETEARPRGAFGNAARTLAADDGWRRSAMAGVSGGLIAFILVILLQAVGLLPAPGRATANAAADEARAATEAAAALERRIVAMEAMTEGLPAIRADIRTADQRATALENGSAIFATKDDLAAANTAIAALRSAAADAPAPATAADVTALGERVQRLEVSAATGASGTGASSEAVASLTDQLTNAQRGIATLSERLQLAEAKVAALSTGQVGSGASAIRAMAMVSLRRAAEAGSPFESEVDAVSALGVSPVDVGRLRAYATTGVPSAQALSEEFPRVADGILSSTATADPEAGFFQRMFSGLGSLVSIRPAGPIAGSDPVAIVSRMTAAVAAGDLATALKEREGLPEAGKAASESWAAQADARVSLDAVVDAVARSFDGAGTG